MVLKDFKIGDIAWIKTPWLCNEFGNTDSIIKIEEISDDVCKYSFPIIEHFVRHYTGPETDTFEIDANTEATPQFTQDGFEKELHREYDKSQCVYGKDSTMPCMFCSATCQARYKDFTEKGVKIVEIPVRANVPDSNGRTYSKEALENAVKEYNAKHDENKLEIRHDGTVEFIVATNEAFENAVNKEMLNKIYKHDYEDSSRLINPYLIDNEKIISEVCKHINSKLIGSDIVSIKREDIPNAIADTLSRCLKKKVVVDGNGLDGNDLTAKMD